MVIFSLLLLTFGVGFAQLTASTNADLDPELPLLTRHPEFLHAGIAAGWRRAAGDDWQRLLAQEAAERRAERAAAARAQRQSRRDAPSFFDSFARGDSGGSFSGGGGADGSW